ncbi:hypothetical protein OEZ86_003706 [Tetradesmus obliquus]|nr:hypothetical protein OEZ86_003706 [Tetradesmus obliquus]
MKRDASNTDTVFAAYAPPTEAPWQQQQQQHGGYPLHKVSSGGASAASERLQDLQESSSGQLADPWSREAGPEDGVPVLAEETFMQHVTRVYKVNKRVWDFYTKLTVQQAVRVSGSAGGAAAAQQQQDQASGGWMDPTTFS